VIPWGCEAPSALDIHWVTHDNVTLLVTQEPRDHQLTLRIPQRIRKALDAQAKAERRSLADVLNNLLIERYPTVPLRKKRRR
jgi:hypothetical protein